MLLVLVFAFALVWCCCCFGSAVFVVAGVVLICFVLLWLGNVTAFALLLFVVADVTVVSGGGCSGSCFCYLASCLCFVQDSI